VKPPATDAIPLAEVGFNPHSFRDRFGRVFEWRGEVYRAIGDRFLPLLNGLLETGALSRIVDRGLMVGTELTPYVLEGYSAVVRHARVPLVSYPPEWSPAMLKDAARLTLDLVSELARDGMVVDDPHPWNVLFDATRPVFIDLTSIARMRRAGRWSGSSSFRRNTLHPLLLMTSGRDEWARWLMSTDRGVWRRDVLGLLPRQSLAMVIDYARDRWSGLDATIKRLRAKVESVSVPPAAVARADSSGPMPALDSCLRVHRPKSVLMIDEHDPVRVAGVAAACERLVVIDRDPHASSSLYSRARVDDIRVLPLVMDFSLPTPTLGLFGSQSVSGLDRFRSDLVVATRFVRYLESDQRRLSCEQLLRGLSQYSAGRVAIAYEPPTADLSTLRDRASFEGLERFTATARSCFSDVEVLAYGRGRGALLVCRP